MTPLPTPAPRRRCSSCATSTPATGRSARSSACRSQLRAGQRARAARLERRGQDDRSPACAPGSSRRRSGDGAASTAIDVTGWRPYRFARLGHRARARRPVGVRVADGRGEPRADVPARARGRARRAAPRSTRRTSCSRGSASGARSSPARSRAASSACCRSRGCWSSSRGCSSPTSSRSGSRRSSSTRCTARSRRSATRARRCCIVEQHVHHALAIADDAIVLDEGRGRVLGPGRRARRPPGAPARRRRRSPTASSSGVGCRTARACVTRGERVDHRRRASTAHLTRRARSS